MPPTLRVLPTVWVLALAVACSDALERDTTAGIIVAVANRTSVSLVDATTFAETTLPLGPALAPSGTLATRDSFLLVPIGAGGDSIAVVRLLPTGASTRFVRLAAGSGAAGLAFQNDSLAWVANAARNTVTQFNYLRGDTIRSVAVGAQPRAIAVVGSRVLVVNANATGGVPPGPSSVTWFTCCGASVRDSFSLTGTGAGFAALGEDGLLYVVESGTPGRADGRLSIVDPVSRVEVAVVNGLGESPGPAVYHPSGRLLVASRTEGILEVNTLTRSVKRGPGNGIKPGGDGIAALALDPRGRVYAVAAKDCAAAGTVHVHSGPPDYRELHTVTVGVCPSAAGLALLPPVR